MTAPRTLTTPDDLVAAGFADPGDRDMLAAVTARYALALPPAMAEIIDRSDPNDPIALQFLPGAGELRTAPGERPDPIGDGAHSPVPGIVHRYPDRVLLKAVHVCPVYCRFCFRREMVGPQGLGTLGTDDLSAALDYIKAHEDIWEVILTGGDPLVLSPRRLTGIMTALGSIAHVAVVRLHSRVPLVTPESIDDAVLEALKASGKTVYLAVHANHPREFSDAGRAAVARLAEAGVALVGQTVLLRGINDDVETLAGLMRVFVANRIKPYYLHHPDLAPGTAHFRLSIGEGQRLVAALRGRISGLCQPTYVLDIPGGHGKAPLGPSAAKPADDGTHEITDFRGTTHTYPPESGT